MGIDKDSIVAIATGSSAGGLGVIRISGSRAYEILKKVFLPKKQDSSNYKPRYMYYGSFVMTKDFYIKETQKKSNNFNKIYNDDYELIEQFNPDDFIIVDEVLAVYFPSPNSYTGEDVVEIHAHGGNVLLQNILEYIINFGIRQAYSGEFTKRAFLNGRIDLSQAEAVAELIAAPALEGIKLASAKLQGLLGKKIEELREQIEYIRRRICLAIDFPEEEGECLPHNEFQELVQCIINSIEKLISAYERTKPWQEGCLVVLAGQVNVGKSSLMNTFLGRKRAIVTAEAGTTRDYLEESCFLDGLPIKLTDTAGLRDIINVLNSEQSEFELNPAVKDRLLNIMHNDTPSFDKSDVINPIELEGIKRSLERMEQADLILMVYDGERLLSDLESCTQEEKIKHLHRKINAELALLPENTKKICIWNKSDIAPLTVEEKADLEVLLNETLFCICANPRKNQEIMVSTNLFAPIQQIEILTKYARNLLIQQELVNNEIAPNRRQVRLLKSATQELQILIQEIETMPPDINAIRLDSAAQYLSAITGLSSIDDTFNAIFEEFCIGK